MKQFGILNTKLYKPEVREDYVFRKEIVEYIEQNRSKPLTLVVAPAGYGKSVAVSEWLDVTKSKWCWISIDKELNDLGTFLSYLTYAVKSVVPDSMQELQQFVKSNEQLPERIISDTLINELDDIKDELIIVLDDYYFIQNNKIHDIINELLRYPPKNFHLVIITRFDPPLNLSYIKAYGLFNEIRMSELNLNKNQIFQLSKNITGRDVSEKTVDLLLEKTEGWIVGLRLALLTLKSDKNLENSIVGIRGNKQFFTQYLLDEVFLRQNKEIQDILLIASILDRFNKDLLKQVMKNNIDQDESISLYDDLFERFKSSTFLIIPLDQEKIWFRYHHLFKEFLSNQLKGRFDQKQIAEFHKNAYSYFDGNNLYEEAMIHAINSGDVNLAVKIVEKNKYYFIDYDHQGRLLKLLKLLPASVVESQPSLLLCRAFLCDASADYVSMGKDLNILKELLAATSADQESLNQLESEYNSVFACYSFMTGDVSGALEHSAKALETMKSKSNYLHDFAMGLNAFALNANGNFEDAISMLRYNVDKLSASESISLMRNLIIQVLLCSYRGYLPEILKLANKSQPIILEHELWISLAYAKYFLAEVRYQWNELDNVAEHVDALEEYKYAGRPFWVLNCFFTKAFTLQAQRKIEELEIAVININKYADDFNNENLFQLVKAFEVELALREYNYPLALKLSHKANFEVYIPVYYFYFPQLTYIKLLLNSGDADKVNEGKIKMKQIIEFGRTTFRDNLLIAALPLQALYYSLANDKENTVNTINEALKLSEPNGYIRNFLDLGKPMEKLLKKIYETSPGNKYLNSLLSEFEKENAFRKNKKGKKRGLSFITTIDVTEKLSLKEIELLKLVAMGLRNKEIAENLHLSLDSIKKYLYYIYQKLGVKNRVAAIARANELQIIPKI